MKTILLSQGKYALVDDQDFEWLNQWKWYYQYSPNKSGRSYAEYAIRQEKGTTVYMHRRIMETVKGEQVDHINRNGLDNRRTNLRNCTQSENNSNRGAYSKIGYRYVYYDKSHKQEWVVQKNHKYQGRFSTALEAHKFAEAL